MQYTIQDAALMFGQSIATFLRENEEYIKAHRYKHRQEALKVTRNQALRTARAWAERIREYMEVTTNPDTHERYAGKLYQQWVEYMVRRDAYMDEKSKSNLDALKEAEKALRAQIRATNAILNA